MNLWPALRVMLSPFRAAKMAAEHERKIKHLDAVLRDARTERDDYLKFVAFWHRVPHMPTPPVLTARDLEDLVKASASHNQRLALAEACLDKASETLQKGMPLSRHQHRLLSCAVSMASAFIESKPLDPDKVHDYALAMLEMKIHFREEDKG